MITKQVVRGNVLVTHTQRVIHERRAVIHVTANGKNELLMYQDGVRYLLRTEEFAAWPLSQIQRYVADVQLGGRTVAWHCLSKTAAMTTWGTDTLLGDSGGNGFNEAELDLIRRARTPKNERCCTDPRCGLKADHRGRCKPEKD